MGDQQCPTCGRPLNAHNRHVRFQRPDVVLGMSEQELEGRVWEHEPLLSVRGVGCYVRTLLPVALAGGYTVTFGVWLSVAPEDLRHAWPIWHEPEYADLRLEGQIANALPPWGEQLVGTRVGTEVREPIHVPYVCRSDDPLVSRILVEHWPHDDILPALPA